MAGLATRRCDNPVCRRPVMVADRDGTVGNAWGSVVVNDPVSVPRATCAICHQETSWQPKVTQVQPLAGWPLADAHVRNLSICADMGHDPVDRSSGPAGSLLQRICQRCGSVYAEGGAG